MPAAAGAGPRVTVVVELAAEPVHGQRGLAGRNAVRTIEAVERRVESRILTLDRGAEIGWRYRRVLAGFSVSVPAELADDLRDLPEVAAVYPSVTYRPLLSNTPGEIGATDLWGPGLGENRGWGIKIGIIDDGIDASHPFFDPSGFATPPAYPKGEADFTSAKVIVARAFPPPRGGWVHAGKPFDPVHSFHGTHVAGIAAGNEGTRAPASGGTVETISGVAPLAQIGNYKALTIPTAPGLGLNGNSPEIVAAIEAAVEDGMDVINLSLGQPEVPPGRDVVAKALDSAATAGVVPVVAAGNDFDTFGTGALSSPGSAEQAVTVAASGGSKPRQASFSSGGPTPLGNVFKPDVTAPGVSVLSAHPMRQSGYSRLSGTSMAAPHVAGAAALLRERHPGWTVEQIKSALVVTGRRVNRTNRPARQSPSTRQGGGFVRLAVADDPEIFVSPQGLAFGRIEVLDRPQSESRRLLVRDAAGTESVWAVRIVGPTLRRGVRVTAPATVEAPDLITISVDVQPNAREGERTGWIVLRRNGDSRRVPFWFRVTKARLPDVSAARLSSPGMVAASTAGGTTLVHRYRYPQGTGATRRSLRGPEVAYRVRLSDPVANLGAVVISEGSGVAVEPRIVERNDENRLVGRSALPLVINPYLERFGQRSPTSAALLPGPGEYTLVFDSASRKTAGGFVFRWWVDDVAPPRIRVPAKRGRVFSARITDAGAGVDPASISYSIDGGRPRRPRFDPETGIATITLRNAKPGRHELEITAADYQELKNTENVPRILPNTRTLKTTVTVP